MEFKDALLAIADNTRWPDETRWREVREAINAEFEPLEDNVVPLNAGDPNDQNRA